MFYELFDTNTLLMYSTRKKRNLVYNPRDRARMAQNCRMASSRMYLISPNLK